MYRGRYYSPDFIVQTTDMKYIVEVKARGELEPGIDTEVKEKALAAIRWCQIASTVKIGLKWEYKLIPDDVIKPTHDFKFILGNACSLTVE
jgi:type III restriction enzyme